jgi:hypothetical protein
MTSLKKSFSLSFHLILVHWNVLRAKYRHTAPYNKNPRRSVISHTVLQIFFFLRRFCHLPASDKTSITFSSTRLYLKHIKPLTPSRSVPANYYRIGFNSAPRPHRVTQIKQRRHHLGFDLFLIHSKMFTFFRQVWGAAVLDHSKTAHTERKSADICIIRRYSVPCFPVKRPCVGPQLGTYKNVEEWIPSGLIPDI